MEGTTASTQRKSDDKLGGLFSCWGRLSLKFRWLKVRRSGRKHYKNLTTISSFDCKSLASVAIASKQPRPVGEFRYDPLSYSQNFDEGCWYYDEGGYVSRGFSSRFASLPSKPMPVNTLTTTNSSWN